MRIKILLFIVISFCGIAPAQQYPLVTIQDIQYLPDSVIAIGDSKSPLDSQTVRVRGVVLARTVVNPVSDRRRLIAAGARWTTYIQDQNNQVWGGINVIQHDTVAAAQGTFFDLVDTAQIVEFTGKVEEFSTSTQLALLTSPVTPVNIIGQLPKRPDPIELEVTDFMENGKIRFDAEKYEGMYVIIRNVFSSDRSNTSSDQFKINDGLGNYLFMYDQSGFFTKRAHRLVGITEHEPPVDGATINFIRGVIQTRTDAHRIVPIYPGDISITKTPPVISSIQRNTSLIQPNQAVTITSKIMDLDGYVTQAKLRYRVNGGSLNEINMTKTADTTVFSAVIPGIANDSALVDFYIWSKDNEDKVSLNPTDTVAGKYFYLVLNRPVTIQDVQYSPFGSGFSGYNNYKVTLTGVVTADSSDLPGYSSTPLRLYMQNGTGPWSGIQIGTTGGIGTQALTLRIGDNVTVSGTVTESFGVTRIDSLSQIVVNSSGNPSPAAEALTTGEIGKLANGNVQAEKWESVLIKYKKVSVTAESADGASNFGEIFVSDGSGETRVELQDGNHPYHNNWDTTMNSIPGYVRVYNGSYFEEVQGILFFSFSNYKLVPRKGDDFVGFIVGVEDQKSEAPDAYQLSQNYPNPFNPSTTIDYSIPVGGFVTIKIFNILGQEVKSIVNLNQEAGNYKVHFDAGDLTSGVYLYQLNVGSFKQVRKMLLLK